MEICSRLQHIQDNREINSNQNQNQNQSSSSSPMNSPSPRSNASNNNNYNNNNCMSSSNSNSISQIQIPTSPHTPKTLPRSDSNNPYPTTFVQADTTTFKHVVQMLTGSSTETATKPPPPPQDPFPPPSSTRNFNIPPIKTAPIKKQGFKLYERRNSLKNNLILNTMMPNFSSSSAAFSPRQAAELLSPSLLDFPSLTLSPVTPLNDDALGNSSSSEEDKAIAEKGFYLHPSPVSTPRDSEPQLLPLFPLSSPRVSGSATTTT
ncbi:VQ motif-containing protein 4-like [Lotus japonicus]|uniref:VQ motif-containing protein 4-like n=1 Tax=Lotus japonicus TaxID=34305 RepID=UPI002589251F|nr:VQ motif-containing protein 4-like [Lotus japonicus]